MNRRHVIPALLAAVVVVVGGYAVGTAVGKIGGRGATSTVIDRVIATGSVLTTHDHGQQIVVHLPAQTVTRDGQQVTLPATTRTVDRTQIIARPAQTLTVTRTTTRPGTTQTVTTPGSTVTVTIPVTGPTTTQTDTTTETITTTPGSGPPTSVPPPPTT